MKSLEETHEKPKLKSLKSLEDAKPIENISLLEGTTNAKNNESSINSEEGYRKDKLSKSDVKTEKFQQGEALFLNRSAEYNKQTSPPRRKYNTISLTDRPRRSLRENGIPYEADHLPETTPRFTKVIIKIKDMEIQTDDDPFIRPEHLFENSKDFSQILDHSQLNVQTEAMNQEYPVLNKAQLRMVIALQRFYKERYIQNRLRKFRLEKESKRKLVNLQRAVRAFLLRKKFSVILKHMRGDKLVMKKKIKKLKSPQNSFFEFMIYFLSVVLMKRVKTLNWILFDFYSRQIIETFTPLTSIIDNDSPISCPDNLQRIMAEIETLIPRIEVMDGYFEFSEKRIRSYSDEVDKEEFTVSHRKNFEGSKRKTLRISGKDLHKLELVQRKVRQVQDKSLLTERLQRKFKTLNVFHWKLTPKIFIRLCYCVCFGEKPEKYIGGAIIGDSTYKLNTVTLDRSLLKFYKRVNIHNIFDIVSFCEGLNKLFLDTS